MILLVSTYIKLTMTSDLMFFNILFMLVTWVLLSSMKFFLFSWWALGSYVNMWLGLTIILDHPLDVVNTLCFESRECLFDFENTFHVTACLGGLCIWFVWASICLSWFIWFEDVTNFIQLVSLQPVDWISQTKLCCKAPNESYLYIYGMYKSNNKQPRYQAISNCKSFINYYLMNG